ncbi:hypothetical protein F0562_015118 [Nyssa sinensis]|uniref:PROP1-like PPR domain-containing protein n=1 Tax=Nyssa sinensis TaxID=561372 RepID=A0A5J4ZGH6_9ASTE|nr:hypothetical protein F0562_015118 [Nyssa sinensis]
MPSTCPSPYPPPSSLHHPWVRISLPKIPLFFSNYINNQQGKLALCAKLPTSSRNSLRSTPSKILSLDDKTTSLCPKEVSGLINQSLVQQKNALPIKEEHNLDKSYSRLQVQDLVARIRALPNTQRIEIIKIVERDGGFSIISDFNDLLMALVIADEPELALKLYSKLTSYGLVPDCWTYSVMIRCHCKRKEPSEANRVLDHMVKNGFQPNVATFTVLINTFCRRGRVQKAFEVLEVMGGIGCEPTVQTYNCLLKGLCYVGRVEEAYKLLMNIEESSKKPDIYTYTAVMDGFCKVGRSNEALELLDETLEMGLTPNVVTYNTLFNGYFKEGMPLKGVELLNQMKERNCMPDYISYSTLLHGLLKWGEIRAALQIYKEMVEAGFDVDERMMNTLLRGLCRRSRTEEDLLKDAYEVFDKMKNEVSVIYPCTYGLVVEAFCTGKELDKALANLKEMVGVGHAPRTITFNTVIRALAAEGKLDEALSVVVLVYEESKIPSRVSFNILIDEFNRQGRTSCACNVYGAALKRGMHSLNPSQKIKVSSAGMRVLI